MPLAVNLKLILATSASAATASGIEPFIKTLSIICLTVCVLFLIIGGFRYMTSSGSPVALAQAKKIIKNTLIGLVIVLSAATLSNFLSNAYGSPKTDNIAKNVPAITTVTPESKSSGIINIIIKTITGVLNNIVQTIATPFLNGLSFFTSGTPLIVSSSSVFNIWLIVVGIADGLFTLVIILLGLHVMSFASLGLEEISLTQLLPRIGFGYLMINSSIFVIDAFISLSNLMIHVISQGVSTSSLWQSLTQVVQNSGGYGLATLIVMVIFLVFSVILMIFYVGRLVTIYLGGVLSPLIVLIWLLPGLRDFAMTAAKKYFSLIFVLFVHVVILELAASIISSIVNGSNDSSPLMALIIGLATLVCLLKTQGVMSQLSYAAIGPRTARQIGQRLILNMSYIGRESMAVVSPIVSSFSSSSRNQYLANSYSSSNNSKSSTASGSNLNHSASTSNNEGSKK